MVCKKENVQGIKLTQEGLYEDKRLSVVIHFQYNSTKTMSKESKFSLHFYDQKGKSGSKLGVLPFGHIHLLHVNQLHAQYIIQFDPGFPQSHKQDFCFFHSPHFTPTLLLNLQLSFHFPPNQFVELLVLLSRFSHVQLCATPQTAAHQAPPSLRSSRQEHWSGLPFPSPMQESEK